MIALGLMCFCLVVYAYTLNRKLEKANHELGIERHLNKRERESHRSNEETWRMLVDDYKSDISHLERSLTNTMKGVENRDLIIGRKDDEIKELVEALAQSVNCWGYWTHENRDAEQFCKSLIAKHKGENNNE